MFKHLVTDPLQYALANYHHQTRIQKCRQYSQQKDTSQYTEGCVQF